MQITRDEMAAMIDHTNLKAYADEAAIRQLCEEARTFHFACVMVNPAQVRRCAGILADGQVTIGAVVGFPLGQATIRTKVFEAEDAIAGGAGEIDYVLNIAELKNGDTGYIAEEMKAIVGLCRGKGVVSKVIFENCYLTDAEKRQAAEIARQVRPDFVKTSTGFGTGGATVDDVRLMKEVVGDAVKVKAAGGIRDRASALAMIEAGARRIGASAGVAILKEWDNA